MLELKLDADGCVDLSTHTLGAKRRRVEMSPPAVMKTMGASSSSSSSSGWGSAFDQVVANLEKRFASHAGMEDSDTGSDSGSPLGDDTREHPKRKRKAGSSSKQANKEEQAWIDEGVGFLADDALGETEEPEIRCLQEKLLEFDGFYVHRGPLLSDDAREEIEKLSQRHYAKRKAQASSNKKTRKDPRPSMTEKERKHARDLVGRFVSSVETVRSKLEDPSDWKEMYSRDLDNSLHGFAKLLGRQTKKEKQKYMIRLANEAFPPGQSEATLERHMERVQLQNEIKQHRKAYRAALHAFQKWVQERGNSTGPPREVYDADVWREVISKLSKLDTSVLEQLYEGDLKESVNGFPSPSSTSFSSNATTRGKIWAEVSEELDKLFKRGSLKVSKLSKKRRMIIELCKGFFSRKAHGKDFVWDKNGLDLLINLGKQHQKFYNAAAEVWKLETGLLGKTRTLCKDRDGLVSDVSNMLSKKDVKKQEILAIISDSDVSIENSEIHASTATASTAPPASSSSTKKRNPPSAPSTTLPISRGRKFPFIQFNPEHFAFDQIGPQPPNPPIPTP